MVREQFTNSCAEDAAVFLKERSPKDLEELATLAEQYLNAHGKKLSTKVPVAKQDVNTVFIWDSKGHDLVLSVVVEAIEQWSVRARHQRYGMSRLVVVTDILFLYMWGNGT